MDDSAVPPFAARSAPSLAMRAAPLKQSTRAAMASKRMAAQPAALPAARPAAQPAAQPAARPVALPTTLPAGVAAELAAPLAGSDAELDARYRPVLAKVRAVLVRSADAGVRAGDASAMLTQRMVGGMSEALRVALDAMATLDGTGAAEDQDKMALHILRVAIVGLQLKMPLFAAAWLVFRVSGELVHGVLQRAHRGIEARREQRRNKCICCCVQ